MIVLDTNVISALMRSQPDQAVIAWLDRQPAESIWTTAITVFEIRFGLAILPSGKKRDALETAFDQALREDLGGRVLDFDATAAHEASRIAAHLRAAGRTTEIRDVQIAGITLARRGTLATRNTRHFVHTGVSLVDPWNSDAA